MLTTLTMQNSLKTCKIEFKETKIIVGTCIKLLGGTGACKSDNYVDPYNSFCN